MWGISCRTFGYLCSIQRRFTRRRIGLSSLSCWWLVVGSIQTGACTGVGWRACPSQDRRLRERGNNAEPNARDAAAPTGTTPAARRTLPAYLLQAGVRRCYSTCARGRARLLHRSAQRTGYARDRMPGYGRAAEFLLHVWCLPPELTRLHS